MSKLTNCVYYPLRVHVSAARFSERRRSFRTFALALIIGVCLNYLLAVRAALAVNKQKQTFGFHCCLQARADGAQVAARILSS